MERSPSRLRNAGGFVAGSMAGTPESQVSDDRNSSVRRSTRAADHSRVQVQSALDGLLGDDEFSQPRSPSIGYEPVDVARSPGPPAGGGRRRSYNPPEPIEIDESYRHRGESSNGLLSPTRKASAVTADGGGYTPTAAGGKSRRRSSVRSPKSYGMGPSQVQGVSISTLEGLQVFLDEKQKEVESAHARRTNELETTLMKEEKYFAALLDNELEKRGVKLKATSAILNRGNSVANNLYRRGSGRLSTEGGMDDALQSKHSDDMKKADHLRKKLKTHHDEARTVLAKKLQVENARMGRVIKTSLAKYANPKLAQSAKVGVLASVVDYLNGEEFVRIVTAPLNYKSPDFVSAVEADAGAMGVNFTPTNARQRSQASLPVEATDYDTKMEQLRAQKRIEQQQQMADEARRRSEMLARESRAAMEKDAADALARDNEENRRRQEENQRQQEEELAEQRRLLEEHQEHLRQEAEIARMRHKQELELRRVEMEREREEVLAAQAKAKRVQEEELIKQREEMQRKHEEDMERQRQEVARHAEEVARHKAELAKHHEEARLEQEALEEMRRRAQKEEDDERRRLEEELAKHQEDMRLEAERVKAELEALRLEREAVALAEEAERAAEEEARRAKEAQEVAEAKRAAEEEQQRQASEAAMRAKIEAELEERVARDIQAEKDRVAAESAALQEKMREFEEQRKAIEAQAAAEIEAQKAAAELAAAEREAALAVREKEAAQSLALGRALSQVGLERAASLRASSQGPGPGGYSVGDKVEALCTPVGAPAGTKAYISGEVAHCNPDGSLDVILSDGRMRQEVPVAEILFVSRTSPTHLLTQTQSFGAIGDGESAGGGRAERPQRAVKAGSLDDILGTKMRSAAPTNTDGASLASGEAAGAVTPSHTSGKALAAAATAAGGSETGSAARQTPAKKRGSLDDILGIKVGKVVKGSTAKILQVGDVVEVLTPPVGGEPAAFSPGVINCVHPDGSVDIVLNTGKRLVQRPAKDVRTVRKARPSADALAPGDLAVGDRVEARYGGSPEFLPGVVTSTEDGASINFDAGWHGASLPLKDVRRPINNVNSSTQPATTRRDLPPSLTSGAQLRSMGNILDLDVGSLGGDSLAVGDQVQFRNALPIRVGPPKTLNGVVRTAHPNGSYLVGFHDGTTRDQVEKSSLTAFDWTRDGSEDYCRAAIGEAPVTATVPTTPVTPASSKNAGTAAPEMGKPPIGAPGGRTMSKSSRLFDKFGPPGRVFPEGVFGGGTGAPIAPRRRATHAGVVESGGSGLRLNMLHFSPQAFMDPDTAAQALLTPNNAGMFRGRAGGYGREPKGHRHALSELSSNTTTDDEEDAGIAKRQGLSRNPPFKNGATGAKTEISPFAPKRRMTFGGIRSDKRGEIYKAQRRPSFLEGVGRQAVGVAETAAKVVRRLSFQGNTELVAIAERKTSIKKSARRKSGDGGGGDGEESDESLCENETHFYNRRRHVFEPQHTESSPSAWWIRTCGIFNLICMAVYLWWRCLRSLIGVKHLIWAYIFLIAECIMAIGMIVGHSSRSFPVHREKVFMDDLTEIDDTIGSLKVAVLIPTCGESVTVMLKALFGNLQLRLWRSSNTRRETLRVVVLDEKRREEVQKLVSLVYTLAEVVLDKTVREILMREGVAPISAKGFYDHFANGEHAQRMYDDVNFIRGVEIVSEIDKLIAANDDSISRFSPHVAISRIKERARRASCFDRKEIQPGQKKVWDRNKYIPTIVYYSRVDAGQPRISPKAGNMNRAIFSFNPREEPLIGEAAVVVVNDVRHELYPEFLQRTCPYFFTFDRIRRCYKWANIAFIQTPQRFEDRKDWNDPDPLGNQAATQFDIVNSGRDGAGGALSCGQGSVWRVQVLRDGIRPDGTKFIKKGLPVEDQVGTQGGLGFRAEVLIEDTHTSIDLFRQGWRSVYVNFPNEILARCTLPPDTVKWRWKQVLRWHQGAVQLAMWKGWRYAMVGENWATFFQKVFAFDAVSYFLQAFAGEVLLIFPIVYGFTNSAPFNTWNIEFALFFFPFIITGVLPTVAAMGWQKTPSAKVMRDEQIWFATSFVQIYAVLHAVWGTITRKDPSNAWNIKCPVWPLHLHFCAIIVAVVYNTIGWVIRSYEEPWVWVSCIGSALFALHSLWPVVSFDLGVTMPEAFYTRIFGMLIVMTLVSMWLLGEGGAA